MEGVKLRHPTAAFSYYGGKQRIASKIVPLLPAHTVYVETHAGGLAVLFTKGQKWTGNKHDYREVINDTNNQLITFYRIMQDPVAGPALCEQLRWTLYSREEHQRARGILLASESTEIEIAWAWFVRIQQGFSNQLHSGWKTSVFGRNQASTWNSQVNNIEMVRHRLACVHIESLDQCEIIAKWDSPQTCFYVDPPYVGADQGHYVGYIQADFNALLARLDAIQGSFVLSCYDNLALSAYPHWKRYEIAAYASSSGSGKTGVNRDKSRAATAEELGDRSRTELVFVKKSTSSMRSECRKSISRLRQEELF